MMRNMSFNKKKIRANMSMCYSYFVLQSKYLLMNVYEGKF